MRTTLDLPKDLILNAMEITHKKTKTETIVYALENIIQKEKIKEIKFFQGKIKLDINLNTLRNR